MATFKDNNFVSSDALIRRQRGKSIIYVEGESDKIIFEKFWFVEYLEKVSFATVPKTQGCAAVVRQVGEDRQNGVQAFGIVDRDKLMADNHWALLRETDDLAFEAMRPYKDIKVTCRWELESYLIDPVVIEAYVAVAEGGRTVRHVSTVEDEFLEHANALIPLAALNQALHLHREAAVGDGFPAQDCRAQVEARIHSGKLACHPNFKPDYDAAIPVVEAFGYTNSISSGNKMLGLLRILSGKAMLLRISKAFKIKDDIAYFLARDIKQSGRVPTELMRFIQSCAS